MKIYNKYFFLLFAFLLFSCNKRKEWNSPYDSITSSSLWVPQDLNIIQVNYTQIKLTWTQDNLNIDGFKIDRKKGYYRSSQIDEEWEVNFAIVDKYTNEWTDKTFIADPDLLYYYRVSAYAGNNNSSSAKGHIRPEPIPNTFKDYRDNQFYKYVEIGTQTWMAQNLNYFTETGSWNPNNSEEDGKKYGRLYNISTAASSCPQGWHLPTDDEWKILEKHLGMSDEDVDKMGDRFSGDVGIKLQPYNIAFDNKYSVGFDTQFGGIRLKNGEYTNVGFYAFYWSKERIYRHLIYGNTHIRRTEVPYSKEEAMSVRCIKD